MKRSHTMPFGATLTTTGEARFRLWAPAAGSVDLLLGAADAPLALPMRGLGTGWFEGTAAARPGTRYRFRIDGGLAVPDPASRFNPDDVHRASEVVDPQAFEWQDGDWRGRPWEEAVLYELHVGTFAPEGTFAGVERRLDYLVGLGVTAIELMPVGDFPGRWNWGYDGVLPFAPDASYGRPEDLKRLIQAAHLRGLMVLLDVVYNHFGPDGNYLYAYARDAFFTERHHTPWGAAINFDGTGSEVVRRFFVDNALYWIEEYGLDGLRLDAVHAILDDSPLHVLQEIAQAVRDGPGRDRAIHLVLENDANQARFLTRDTGGRPRWYDAQWNDDVHHALHVVLTGERDGYYADYANAPHGHLGRCLAEGFAYQGEASAYRGGGVRGEPSANLPPSAFVGFLQTHDQVGNRAFGERIAVLAPPEALALATAVLLLAPSPPLLFMGEEYAATTPFLYFCDFGPELAAAVTQGRRSEFARFERFADPGTQARIPDPNHPETFRCSRLDWDSLNRSPHLESLTRYRQLLALRRQEIIPHLTGATEGRARWCRFGAAGLAVDWTLGDGSRLALRANLGPEVASAVPPSAGRPFHRVGDSPGPPDRDASDRLPPWSGVWYLHKAGEPG
jgi:maltooligosyltrehalose trehalohydrolase